MKRGDVYFADLNPVKGSEQAGGRPVIIYEADKLLDIPTKQTVVIIPLTKNLKRAKLPTCVFVPYPEGGLKRDSVALCHQIRALDKSGIGNYWGTLPASRMEEIDKAMLFTTGIKI